MAEQLYTLRARRPGMVTEGPTPEEAPVLEAHTEYLRRLAAEGRVILAGRTRDPDESAFGIVVFRADGRDEARRILVADPAVEAGLMDAELFRFGVAVRDADAP